MGMEWDSWGGVLELTGFRYSGVKKAVQFAAPKETVSYFWSNGHAWGTCRLKPAKTQTTVALTVLQGKLAVKQLHLAGFGTLDLPKAKSLGRGRTETFVVKRG